MFQRVWCAVAHHIHGCPAIDHLRGSRSSERRGLTASSQCVGLPAHAQPLWLLVGACARLLAHSVGPQLRLPPQCRSAFPSTLCLLPCRFNADVDVNLLKTEHKLSFSRYTYYALAAQQLEVFAVHFITAFEGNGIISHHGTKERTSNQCTM